jgi:U3 small nucleolar RNA-associated protein 23
MRVTRHKALKRALRFYKAAFDFVDPYHVIIDPSFLEFSITSRLNLKSDLSVLLSGRVTPMVTSCIMSHLRRNGRTKTDALLLGKSCYRLKCNHDEKNPLSTEDCIISQLGKDNPRHFMVATQIDSLKSSARVIPATPVLSIHGKLLMLESPSVESREAAQHREAKQKLPKLSETLNNFAQKSEDESLGESKSGEKKKRRKRGANPLSCLPKKIKISTNDSGTQNSSPRKKRVRSKKSRSGPSDIALSVEQVVT